MREGTAGMKRRDFVKLTGAAGGGLLVAVSLPGAARAAGPGGEPAAAEAFEPNAWLSIGTDGTIRFVLDELEMGQGVVNALPMIVAEELGVPLEAITVEGPPEDPSSWPRSIATYGSTSVRNAWDPLRTAAASAREALKAAAARRWSVGAGSLATESGHVVHPGSGRRLGYGELASEAAELPVPEDPPLKDPSDYELLGTATPRPDTRAKVDGSQRYGTDVRVEGMRVAVVARPPVFGGEVASFDGSDALRVDGVEEVVEIGAGVAVVARDTWSAMQGREALSVRWDGSAGVRKSSDEIARELRELARGDGAAVAASRGDVEGALSRADRRIEREYELPYLAHACMEPMNCTADVREDRVELWAPTQSASGAQRAAAEVAGVPVESVVVHALPMGGGFGRRSSDGFVREAVETSMKVGAPVKVVWSREDDTRGGFYRMAACHRFEGGLGEDGSPVAWSHQLGGPSLLGQIRPQVLERTGGWGPNALAGARDLYYGVPDLRVAHALSEVEVPLWWWRSVGHSHVAFAVESFVDELAVEAGADPYRYRRRLLAEQPRLRGVLDRAAKAAGWGEELPRGRGRGVACHPAFGSYVAQVAEVSVDDHGGVRVHRVVSAVDCGQTINPDTIEAQAVGAVAYGLSAALHGEITLEDGRVRQGNFDDYPLVRFDEMPDTEVHVVESGEAPGGVGELGTPCVAPAVANAVFDATGVRVRSLPLDGKAKA